MVKSILAAGLLALAALWAPQAAAEVDVNAVAIFYANGDWRMESWDNIDKLNRRDRRYVKLVVYHVQNAGSCPNAVAFNGAEEIALRRTHQALIVREFFRPNGREVHRFFEDDPVQTIGEAWADSNAGFFAAVKLHIRSRAFGGPYADLTDRADAVLGSLRCAAVPNSGTY